MPEFALQLREVSKNFASGEEIISVLDCVNLAVHKGEGVALVGESGTGKSTLLQISALLEKPTSGDVIINGTIANTLNDDAKTKIRRDNVGFVYQFHNLLPEFSPLENVMLPQLIKNVSRKKAEERAEELLRAVGLGHRLHHPPQKLSGGEKQRVAIARAIANSPSLVIADEPTGNLDPATASIIFDLFLDLTRVCGISVLMATHNLDLTKRLDSVIPIKRKT